nr:cytochrome P450 6A1-like [Neodiprion pinetum]
MGGAVSMNEAQPLSQSNECSKYNNTISPKRSLHEFRSATARFVRSLTLIPTEFTVKKCHERDRQFFHPAIGELFQDIYSKYKKHPIIGVYLFTRPNLVIADLDLLRFVLTKEFPHFHDRGVYCDEKTEPLSGHLFSLPGAKWRFLRNKFSPTFTSSKIKQMFPTVKETSNRLSLIVEKKAQNSEVIEIKDLMARFSTDVIASVAFGIDCNSLENPDAEFRAMGRKFFAPRKGIAGLVFAFPILHKLFKFTAIPEDVTNFFMGAFKEAVKYITANNVVRRDFLDLVIQLILYYIKATFIMTTKEHRCLGQSTSRRLPWTKEPHKHSSSGLVALTHHRQR